ncbi:hypothetical protein K438DRAFT_2021575 [Mycena galopus ATCC 62051]|nr:hypothetical protein K438DRAFT_2021575 [Mycena galopus ATCC 62051]
MWALIRVNSYKEGISQVECRFIQRDFLDTCKSEVHCFEDYLALRAARDVKIACTKAIAGYRSARSSPCWLQVWHDILAPPPPPLPTQRSAPSPQWGSAESGWGSAESGWPTGWGSGWGLASRIPWTGELVPKTPGKRKCQCKRKAARRAQWVIEMGRIADAWAEESRRNELEWSQREAEASQ